MGQELLLKVGLYNHMNDAALASGYGGTRVVISEGGYAYCSRAILSGGKKPENKI